MTRDNLLIVVSFAFIIFSVVFIICTSSFDGLGTKTLIKEKDERNE
jgi:hypothetical protein